MPPAGSFALLSGAQVLRGPSTKFDIFLSLMKRSSNNSESHEWRKVQRTKDSAQGGGAGVCILEAVQDAQRRGRLGSVQ